MGKQKRSPNTYQKINTLYMRDVRGLIIPEQFADPAFGYLRHLPMEATEKIDGTCMRVEITPRFFISDKEVTIDMLTVDDRPEILFDYEIKGKTDNAEIPRMLMERMKELIVFPRILDAFRLRAWMKPSDVDYDVRFVIEETKELNVASLPKKITIYGEGYGNKIGKDGKRILKDSVDFMVFDIKVGDLYLLHENTRELCDKMQLRMVPFIGIMTIDDAVNLVKMGFRSEVAEDETYIAEGLVLKTPYGLCNRFGERIILKIKYRDFVKYDRANAQKEAITLGTDVDDNCGALA